LLSKIPVGIHKHLINDYVPDCLVKLAGNHEYIPIKFDDLKDVLRKYKVRYISIIKNLYWIVVIKDCLKI
jgi:hypothetical protein